jgi:predicted RNase H-like HicB family nuclease
MRKLTAIIHQCEAAEGGFTATCPEVPGANGQGETREECLEDLALAVKLILDFNQEDAPDDGSEEISLCDATALEGAQMFDRMEEEDSMASTAPPPVRIPPFSE